MPRHSKNSTAQAYFSYHERTALAYGTQTAKLTRDSCRDFDACFLCLQRAILPVTCTKGHLACKECLIKSLLKQKEDYEKQKKVYTSQQKIARTRLDDEKQKKELEAKEAFAKQQRSIKSTLDSGKAAQKSENPKEDLKSDHPSTLSAPGKYLQ